MKHFGDRWVPGFEWWSLNRQRHRIYLFLSPNPTRKSATVLAARQFVQFGLSCGQQTVSCSVTSLSSYDSDADIVWHCMTLSGLIVQRCSKSCRDVHVSALCRQRSPWFPQLLDSRAGPKTPIVAPFLDVPDPGSMWGLGPSPGAMQLLPLCVGTLLFHCGEGSQWIRSSMTLRLILLTLCTL